MGGLKYDDCLKLDNLRTAAAIEGYQLDVVCGGFLKGDVEDYFAVFQVLQIRADEVSGYGRTG